MNLTICYHHSKISFTTKYIYYYILVLTQQKKVMLPSQTGVDLCDRKGPYVLVCVLYKLWV